MFHSRISKLIPLVCLFITSCVNQRINKTNEEIPFPIYSSDSLRVADDSVAFAKDIQYSIVEKSLGKYKFLHDPAIVVHNKQLIAAWYNCPDAEISGESRINARRSDDGGLTWSEPETIAYDNENAGIHYVPVQLLSYQDELFSFVGTMTGHDRIVNTTLFKYNNATKQWIKLGKIADLFLPNCAPQKLGNGNWMLAGRVAAAPGELPLTPAILISNGDDLKSPWSLVKLQTEKFRKDQHPETTVIVDGNLLYAFTRVNDQKYIPKIYISKDFGSSWFRVNKHNFRAVSSKLYAGTLSTGQKFIVYNYPKSGDINGRGVLAISISSAAEKELTFSRILRIRSSNVPGSPLDAHYPSAVEYDGKLYIIYTAEFAGEKKRQCELAIVPMAAISF